MVKLGRFIKGIAKKNGKGILVTEDQKKETVVQYHKLWKNTRKNNH